MRKILATAAIAAALVAAPAIASAQQAAAAPAVEVQPANERVEGNEIRGGFILPLLGLIAIILTVYLLTRDDNDTVPLSP